MSKTKVCYKCKVELLIEGFYHKSDTKDRLQSWCRACSDATSLAWQRNNPRKVLVNSAKRRAKKAGLPFDLTVQNLHWSTHCPALGIPLIYGGGGGKGGAQAQSASLDRVVPHLGYTVANVRVISWRANELKKDAEAYELFKVAEYAAKCEEEGDEGGK